MIRVLIVNDSPIQRMILRSILEKDPEVQIIAEARNGKEAVNLCLKTNPDIVTMDIQMPYMNGVEATRKIMSQNPIPVLFVTAHSDTPELNLVFDTLGPGALDMIRKPNGFEEGNEDEWGREVLSKIKTLARRDHVQE